MNIEDANVLINEISKDKCTTWEKNFIASIGRWLKKGKPLTEKQGKALEGIYSRSHDGGKYERKQII